MRPTTQRAVSRRRLIATGIFSMSGPLSLLVRSVISSGSSGQPRGVQKFGLFWKMTSGVQLGSTVDARSRVSLRCLRQSMVRAWLVFLWIHAHASVHGDGDFTRQGGPRIPRSMPGAVHTWKSVHYGPVYLVFTYHYGGSCRPSLLVSLLFTRQMYLSLGTGVCAIMKFHWSWVVIIHLLWFRLADDEQFSLRGSWWHRLPRLQSLHGLRAGCMSHCATLFHTGRGAVSQRQDSQTEYGRVLFSVVWNVFSSFSRLGHSRTFLSGHGGVAASRRDGRANSPPGWGETIQWLPRGYEALTEQN